MVESSNRPRSLYGCIHVCEPLEIDGVLVLISKNKKQPFIPEEPVKADKDPTNKSTDDEQLDEIRRGVHDTEAKW
jgi:hypothetical protein